MAEIIKALTEMWVAIGPMGVGVCFVVVAASFIASASWVILRQQSNTQKQLVDTQSVLASTQQQFVKHVVESSQKAQEALTQNTESNHVVSVSNMQVKESLDTLIRKMGSDPGCKIKSEELIRCQADKMGISPESLTELIAYARETNRASKETNAHLLDLKDAATLAAAAIKEKAIKDEKALDQRAAGKEAALDDLAAKKAAALEVKAANVASHLTPHGA